MKSVQNISPQINKEVKSKRIFFTAVMVIFVLRGVFDLTLVPLRDKVEERNKLLVQDIFDLVWDLAVIIPIMFMHHLKFRTPYLG